MTLAPDKEQIAEKAPLAGTETASDSESLELFPFGIAVGGVKGRPILVLKSQCQNHVFPVWLHPVDAGLAALLSDSTRPSYSSHHATGKILELFGAKLAECRFVDLVGHHQFVDLILEGAPVQSLRMRADSVMSLCLYLKVRFFGTKELIARCREVDVEMTGLEKGLKICEEMDEKGSTYLN